MESQEVIALVALDLSAAFDMVNHNLLWVILGSCFGIDGIPLAWIKLYLNNRSFQVLMGSAVLDPIEVPYAVPQGSLLGPVLFICYISTLDDIIQGTSTSLLGCADNHAVYDRFLPTDAFVALKHLPEVTKKIRNWMRQSFLKMNDSKTEIVIFGTQNQCNKITTMAIEVGETSVNFSQELPYLGVLLDKNLTLKTHILAKAKSASYQLYRIRQIVKFLDLPAMSQLDYANAIFINLTSSSIYPV